MLHPARLRPGVAVAFEFVDWTGAAGIDTCQQPVIYLHLDCEVRRYQGFPALTLVHVRSMRYLPTMPPSNCSTDVPLARTAQTPLHITPMPFQWSARWLRPMLLFSVQRWSNIGPARRIVMKSDARSTALKIVYFGLLLWVHGTLFMSASILRVAIQGVVPA